MYQDKIITLLTDFGLEDVYVGVMKGVIAQINPQLQVIDLTHQIPPHDLAAARFCLSNAYNYFPPETVHVAVVDPGVGSQRRGVAIKFAEGYLVGPDNGIFSGVLSLSPPEAAIVLNNPKYWRTPNPSTTFHGRDIFAPVAAHLASGVPLSALGEEIAHASLVNLNLPEYQITSDSITGSIQYIDHFGNLITNIPAHLVANQTWFIVIENLVIPHQQTYSDTQVGDLLALIGSHAWVEIAVNGGNAQSRLKLQVGNLVEIKFSPRSTTTAKAS